MTVTACWHEFPIRARSFVEIRHHAITWAPLARAARGSAADGARAQNQHRRRRHAGHVAQ